MRSASRTARPSAPAPTPTTCARRSRDLAPGDVAGYDRFLAESEVRYRFGFEDLGRRPMHRLADLVRVLPTFARLRADRSVYAHVARRVRDPRLRMALSFHPLFIGGDPFHVTSIYILVSHLERAFGVHYAMGGVGAIATAMARVVEDQGGEVRLGAEVTEITVRNEAVTGVEVADGGHLPAAVVVSNSDPGPHLRHAAEIPTQAPLDRRAPRPLALVDGPLRLVFRNP